MENTNDTLTLSPSSAGPVDVVQGIHAAFGRGDMPGLFELLHPEIDWSVTVTAPGGELVPMLRHGVGHSAVEHYFGGVGQLEFHTFDVGRCFVDGDAVAGRDPLRGDPPDDREARGNRRAAPLDRPRWAGGALPPVRRHGCADRTVPPLSRLCGRETSVVPEGQVRLVEVLGTLSLACDAADGFAHETTMRTAVLAAGLARLVGDDRLVGDGVIASLLRHIGCTAFAVEEAHRYGAGDDVGLRSVMAEVDFGRPEEAVRIVTDRLAPDATTQARHSAVETLLGDGPLAAARHAAAQCDAAEHLARLLPVNAEATRG